MASPDLVILFLGVSLTGEDMVVVLLEDFAEDGLQNNEPQIVQYKIYTYLLLIALANCSNLEFRAILN